MGISYKTLVFASRLVSVSATGSNCLGKMERTFLYVVLCVSVSATGSNCLGLARSTHRYKRCGFSIRNRIELFGLDECTAYDTSTAFQYPQPDRIVWARNVDVCKARVEIVSVSATGSNCLGPDEYYRGATP